MDDDIGLKKSLKPMFVFKTYELSFEGLEAQMDFNLRISWLK